MFKRSKPSPKWVELDRAFKKGTGVTLSKLLRDLKALKKIVASMQ